MPVGTGKPVRVQDCRQPVITSWLIQQAIQRKDEHLRFLHRTDSVESTWSRRLLMHFHLKGYLSHIVLHLSWILCTPCRGIDGGCRTTLARRKSMSYS